MQLTTEIDNKEAILLTLDRIQHKRTVGKSKFGLSAEMWDEIEKTKDELTSPTNQDKE